MNFYEPEEAIVAFKHDGRTTALRGIAKSIEITFESSSFDCASDVVVTIRFVDDETEWITKDIFKKLSE